MTPGAGVDPPEGPTPRHARPRPWEDLVAGLWGILTLVSGRAGWSAGETGHFLPPKHTRFQYYYVT